MANREKPAFGDANEDGALGSGAARDEDNPFDDAADAQTTEKIFLSEDQKLMVEPWIAVFGRDPVYKLFSKKFAEKESGISMCEEALKRPDLAKTRETFKVACLVVSRAI